MKAKLFYSSLSIASILLLNACSVAKGDTTGVPVIKTVQVYTLQKSGESQTLELTGSISGQGQTALSAKAPGRIEAVYFDIGEVVRKGDLLVKLGGDEAAVNLESAQSAYQNSLASMERTQALMNTQVQSTEKAINTLNVRRQALENTRKSVDEISARQIALAQEQISLTETRLNNFSRSLDSNQADVREQKIRMITQATILTHNIQDQLLGMVNASAGNLSYETAVESRFGQASYQARTDSLHALRNLRDSVETLKSYYDDVIKPGSVSDQELLQGFDLAKGALEDAKGTLEVMHGLFLHTVVSDRLPQEQLDGLRTAVIQLGQQTEALLLSVSGGQTFGFDGLSQAERGLSVERENQQAEFQAQLSIANQQLALTQETRRQQLLDLDDNLLILQSQIAEAENARQTAMASRDAQVQLLKTQADLARGQLAMAEVAYQNTLVKAPSNGIVISRMAEEGEVVSAGMPLMEFADPDRIKIDSQVTEEESAKLKTGMVATLEVDSMPGQTFKVRLARIGAHTDPVTRKVPLEFEAIAGVKALKIGSFARLTLNLSPDANQLLLPDQALLHRDGKEFVFVIQNGAAYEVAVKLGRSYSDKHEIVSGLYEGNQVVISGIEGLQHGDSIEILPPAHE